MAAVIRYLPIHDLMEDMGEYRAFPFVNREDIHGPYCVIQQKHDEVKDKFGKLGGTITCMYRGEIIYERRLDEVCEDGYGMPGFICCEDYKRIKEAIDKFWVRK